MNSILFTGNNNLTTEDLKYIKQAEQIIEKNNKPKKKKGIKIFFIIFVLIIVLSSLFCTIFALLNINNNKIIKNISIIGIDVSEMTIEEAEQKIKKELDERVNTDLILKHNNQTYTLIPTAIELSYNIKEAVERAYEIGRNGNILKNNFEILKHNKNNTDLKISVNYNENLLKTIVPQMNENFDDRIKEPRYEIENNNLIIKAGKDGYVVKYEELKQKMISKLIEKDYNTDSIEIPVEADKCKDIDIEKIHSEIYKEPVDATYTTNPYKITASSNGLDFAISIDEAKQILSTSQETYQIPLKVLYPKVTTDDIGIEAFPNLLASYSTSYATSSANRANNVALAASKINGIVLMPGETFSYNGTVGKRTISAGFKEAGAYSNGQVTSEVGGGICQVSSTLYNAVLRANLEIVDRTNHMFQVGYVPIGTDATVSWGAPDFKFKNSRNYAIKIVARTANRKVYIQVYGLKEETEYDVEILSYRTGTIAYKTTYTTDDSLETGKTKVIQSGSNGATSVTYRILKLNGKEVSRTLISKDTYQPHNQVIARGR